MDFEDKDYIHYLYETSLRLKSKLESYSTDDIFSEHTLSDVEDITKTFMENDGIVVVDNFFQEDVCVVLRDYALINYQVGMRYKRGYDVNDFPKVSNLTLSNIIGKKLEETFPFLGEFLRSWYVRHDYHTGGVDFHVDPPPSQITVNFWVTPNESFPDINNTNGLHIWKENSEEVNRVFYSNLDKELLKSHFNDRYRITIPYRFNRVTFFNSHYFHSSQNGVSYTSWKDRKVNYAFLFTQQDVTVQ